MSKRFLTLAAMFMLAASAFAVPAKRVKRQVQQPDGSVLTVMLRGDENFHYTSTEDGQPLVQRADGAYCYATLDAGGMLTASSQVAHNEGSRGAGEQAFLSYYSAEAQKVRSLQRVLEIFLTLIEASRRSSATTRQRRRKCARLAWSVRSSATPIAWRALRSATLWTLRANR